MGDDLQTNAPDQAAMESMARHLVAIQDTFGDGLPYDQTRLIHECRVLLAKSAETMLEAGKRLVVLRENEPAERYLEIIETQLGLGERAERRLRQAAVKYCSPALAQKSGRLARLGTTKLYELMLEDDDDLSGLADGGTLAGMTLDEIDFMSTRELKLALRNARENAKAADRVLQDKTDTLIARERKIDELSHQLHQKHALSPAEPAEVGAQMRLEFSGRVVAVEAAIRGGIDSGIGQLLAHGSANAIDFGTFLAGQIAQLLGAIEDVRSKYGLRSVADADERPDWMRDEGA